MTNRGERVKWTTQIWIRATQLHDGGESIRGIKTAVESEFQPFTVSRSSLAEELKKRSENTAHQPCLLRRRRAAGGAVARAEQRRLNLTGRVDETRLQDVQRKGAPVTGEQEQEKKDDDEEEEEAAAAPPPPPAVEQEAKRDPKAADIGLPHQRSEHANQPWLCGAAPAQVKTALPLSRLALLCQNLGAYSQEHALAVVIDQLPFGTNTPQHLTLVSILHKSVGLGYHRVVQRMLESGVDPDCPDEDGKSLEQNAESAKKHATDRLQGIQASMEAVALQRLAYNAFPSNPNWGPLVF